MSTGYERLFWAGFFLGCIPKLITVGLLVALIIWIGMC